MGIDVRAGDARTALQELLRLASANVGPSTQAVEEELGRVLSEWRADPDRFEERVVAFAYVAGAVAAAGAYAFTREPRNDAATSNEALEALADLESAVEDQLRG